jgi:iron complex outermembrane receptor protein
MRTLSQTPNAAMLILTLTSFCKAAAAADTPAPTAAGEQAGLQVEEIVVTARKREESLQRVPDAVTAFTAAAIEQAGIGQVSDFAALTPNLTFQEGTAFRAGQFNLSMRGIGNGQEGWTSVSYIVDGVPAGSTDAINSGSLQDIERIEVLRGPQSALYGFNAIAGAINVITRSPTNDWAYQAGVAYGKGDDRELRGAVSGPLIPDKLLVRVAGSWREADGLIESASNGLDLDFKRHRQVRTRLLFTPIGAVSLDLHATFAHERNGSTYQDKVPSTEFLDDFSGRYDARRGFAGADERDLYQLAARLQWDFERFAFVSVTGYNDIEQHIQSSLCYDDPDDPILPDANGNAQCLLGPAFGSAAAAGEPIDDFFDSATTSARSPRTCASNPAAARHSPGRWAPRSCAGRRWPASMPAGSWRRIAPI